MWSTAREVAAGDVVIVWMTRDLIQPLVITPGKELNSKYGVYSHADLVGVPYGSKVRSRNGKGFVHLLRPTPELWTLALPHRTQILYLADIAFITSWLDLKLGSKVIEAGTGSGSFSHSVARTVGPTGHLWSYEFHEARANKAREEFTRHGMDGVVTLAHRNVCKDGFPIVDSADAVFLDLPAPWDAIEHAKKALRKDRATRICCFSPCMEQVLRTVSTLNEAGFTEITMYETLLRPHQVDAAPPLTPVGTVGARLKAAEARREEKRLRQIANARAGAEHRAGKRKAGEDMDGDGGAGEGAEGREKRVKADPDGASGTGVEGAGEGEGEGEGARVPPQAQAQDEREAAAAMDMDTGTDAPPAPAVPETTSLPSAAPAPTVLTKTEEEEEQEAEAVEPAKVTFSKTFGEVRGHTSYLTFAVLLPLPATTASAGASASAVASEQPSAAASADATPAVSLPTTPAPEHA